MTNSFHELIDIGVENITYYINKITQEYIPSATASITGRPRYDFFEMPSSYTIEMELPGYTKEDLTIEVTNDTYLYIKGFKQEPMRKKIQRFIRKERKYNRFVRYVELPVDSDTHQLSGTIQNGILRVIIPKKDKSNESNDSKTIQINE